MQKGIISSIEGPVDRNGDNTRARVVPATGGGALTRPLTIPWWLRGTMGQLKAGLEVVFVVFEDGTGIIIARADGDWFGEIPGDVTVSGLITASDIVAEGVPSYLGHLHNTSVGKTTPPLKEE